MKKLLFFAFAGIFLSACSNSGSKVQSTEPNDKNEVIITNDLENAAVKIPSWKGEITVFDMKDKAHSGGFVGVTNDTLEFSYTYSEVLKNINDRLPKRVIFSGWVNTSVANPKFSIICSTNENGKQINWKAFPLEKELTQVGTWVEFTSEFYFDEKLIKPEDEISLFAWNQSKKPVYIDDLKVRFLY
jgi:hypothetical protein